MNDASTTQPLPTEVKEGQEATGPGRHRGPVSAQDSGAAPRGRHRKPAEQHAESAA
ncbi:hypothetical protein [Streptomyces griseus]|uniref:hypothetical protein n=1 Tax=Streptomyces griseus TaxID=1911 RepID=UPI000B192E8D|nr:hypothetical protein [Streptomyces griseus]